MPIIFEVLKPEPLYAEVPQARLTLAGMSLGFTLEVEDSVVTGGWRLAGNSFAEDADEVFEPIVPAQVGGGLSLQGEAEAFSIDYEEVWDASLSLGGLSLSMEDDEAMVPVAGLTLSGFSVAGAGTEVSYSFLVEQPGIVYGTPGSMITTGVQDSLQMTTQETGLLDYLVSSVMALSDAPSVLALFAAQVTSSVRLHDSLALLLDGDLTATLNLEDPLEADLRIIAMLADVVDFSDVPEGALSPLVTVVTALVLADSLAPVLDGALEDDVELTEELLARVNALVEAVSALELTDELAPTLHMLAVVEGELELGDEPDAQLALLAELLDTVGFVVRFDNGRERFAGYTLNLRTAAVTEYENYDFNSLAMVGGRAYGAREDGIFRLEGDTDDGAPIEAFVRTGALNFDSLSRVPKAWIGLTSDGQMVLKTITTDNGQKKEHWYTMAARPQGAPVESRFSLAKGVTSTYWQWELANVDGAYFELDMLKVWPISIGRRYSGR